MWEKKCGEKSSMANQVHARHTSACPMMAPRRSSEDVCICRGGSSIVRTYDYGWENVVLIHRM